MDIAVIGTGFIGRTLGKGLAEAGHNVTFGSRHPDHDDIASDSPATVASVGQALESAEVVILALPGSAVGELASEHEHALATKVVIDATNRTDRPVANSRDVLPAGARYARAFNTLGGENIANPVFDEGLADMFFSSEEADRSTIETVIEGVGLRPIYVGPNEEDLIDSLFRLWIALAVKQGRGRRLALRLLEH